MDHIENTVSHYCCIQLLLWKHACLWSCDLVMAVVYLLISQSLPWNGSTCHIIILLSTHTPPTLDILLPKFCVHFSCMIHIPSIPISYIHSLKQYHLPVLASYKLPFMPQLLFFFKYRHTSFVTSIYVQRSKKYWTDLLFLHIITRVSKTFVQAIYRMWHSVCLTL
jgi:hypothetical protein